MPDQLKVFSNAALDKLEDKVNEWLLTMPHHARVIKIYFQVYNPLFYCHIHYTQNDVVDKRYDDDNTPPF